MRIERCKEEKDRGDKFGRQREGAKRRQREVAHCKRQLHIVRQTDGETGRTEVMNAVIKLFQLQRGLFLCHYKGNNLSPLIGPVSFLLAHFDLPAYCLDVSYSIANLGQF